MENKWIIGGKDIRKKIKKEKEKVKFLSQGAYGCVFHPGFTCKGNLQTKKYVTKLEIKKSAAIKEFEISEYIRKKIRHYNAMFAPIISYCPILVSKIEKDSIKECSLIENTEDVLYSTKIRYVGKQSLEPYLFSLIDNSSFFIKQLFETHIYLTNSIEKLIHSKIVHFDIKENNILYDNNQYLPIIIDFGLSFRIDLLDTDIRYENAFYVFVSTCTWWCLEIAIISFIVCKEYNPESASSSWMNDQIPISYLLNIVEDYYTNNVNMILISKYWKKEVDISKNKWRDFIKKEFKNKNTSGKKIVEIIMQSWETWDMFALSFLYLSALQDLCIDCLKDYQDFLVKYILAFPLKNERINIKDYYKNLVFFSEKYSDLDTITFDRTQYFENKKKTKTNVLAIENIIYSAKA